MLALLYVMKVVAVLYHVFCTTACSCTRYYYYSMHVGTGGFTLYRAVSYTFNLETEGYHTQSRVMHSELSSVCRNAGRRAIQNQARDVSWGTRDMLCKMVAFHYAPIYGLAYRGKPRGDRYTINIIYDTSTATDCITWPDSLDRTTV